MITWEELSKEYVKEINDLWMDIENAIVEFEKGMPKSYKSGLAILEKCLDLSMENVKMLSCLSADSGIAKNINKKYPKKIKTNENRKDGNVENCFKWLRNTE